MRAAPRCAWHRRGRPGLRPSARKAACTVSRVRARARPNRGVRRQQHERRVVAEQVAARDRHERGLEPGEQPSALVEHADIEGRGAVALVDLDRQMPKIQEIGENARRDQHVGPAAGQPVQSVVDAFQKRTWLVISGRTTGRRVRIRRRGSSVGSAGAGPGAFWSTVIVLASCRAP